MRTMSPWQGASWHQLSSWCWPDLHRLYERHNKEMQIFDFRQWSVCMSMFIFLIIFLLVSYQGKMCVTIHVPARAEWALYSLQYRWPTACIYKPQNCCAWQLLQLQNCQQTVFLTDNFFCRLSARYSEVYVIITALLPALQSVYRTFIICVSCGRQLNCHNHKLPAAIICSMHLEFPSQ